MDRDCLPACLPAYTRYVLLFGTFTNWWVVAGKSVYIDRSLSSTLRLFRVDQQTREEAGHCHKDDYYIYDGNRINGHPFGQFMWPSIECVWPHNRQQHLLLLLRLLGTSAPPPPPLPETRKVFSASCEYVNFGVLYFVTTLERSSG